MIRRLFMRGVAVAALAAGGLGVTGGVAQANSSCAGYLTAANYYYGLEAVNTGLAVVAAHNGDFVTAAYYYGEAANYDEMFQAQIGKYNACDVVVP